jgi:hypothetical protein
MLTALVVALMNFGTWAVALVVAMAKWGSSSCKMPTQLADGEDVHIGCDENDWKKCRGMMG